GRQTDPTLEEPGLGVVHADGRRRAAPRPHAWAARDLGPTPPQRKEGDAMRGALIHGVLLLVMLVYGYRTWTRDKTVKPDLGSVVLWNKTEAELASIEFKSDKKTVHLERKTEGKDGYWWGTETTVEKRPKPKPPEPKP